MTNMTKLIRQLFLWGIIVSVAIVTACNPEEEQLPDPIASFTSDVLDENDFLTVTFTNVSQNAETYSWDFGDESELSDEVGPVHTFPSVGTYEVVLTATNEDGVSDEFTGTITLSDPLEALRDLVGESGKTWQLIADVSTNLYPYEIAPEDLSDVWWQLTGNNDPNKDLCYRSCIMDDTWTFNPDGTFTFDNHGDFWAEGGVWDADIDGCFDATDGANWVGHADNGSPDLSAWNSGTHDFTYDPLAGTLTVSGEGAFVGLPKVGSNGEVVIPQSEVVYDVVKLVNDNVDTLVIQVTYPLEGAGSTNMAYWKFGLVSYDNPADEVVIEECPPVTEVQVTFKVNMNEYSGAFTTPEVNGTFNGWCGNCNAMTDVDQDGIWETTLTLNANTDYDYKYSFDSWTGQEELTEGDACTITDNGFTNRRLSTAEEDVTLGAVCWESCEDCTSTSVSSLSIDFESNPPTWVVFGGPASDGNGVTVTEVANPVSGGINTSATVAQIDEADGSQGWTGIHTTLEGKLDFSTNTTIKVKVYSPTAGAVIKLKVEDSADGNINKEIDQTITNANTWEELSFTFASDDSNKFDRIVLFFDFQSAAKSGARTHYFDDISL